MNFTPEELHVLRYAVLATYEEPRTELIAKLDAALSAHAPGQLVFQMEFALWSTVAGARRKKRSAGIAAALPPRLWSPTLNEYKGIRSYELTRLRKVVDEAVLRTKTRYPRWSCGCVAKAQFERGRVVVRRAGGRRRLVVVDRQSNRPPDELSADAIGGKVPIDRFVAAGILRDDTPEWCARDSKWTEVAPGAGRVIVSVYEIREE